MEPQGSLPRLQQSTIKLSPQPD